MDIFYEQRFSGTIAFQMDLVICKKTDLLKEQYYRLKFFYVTFPD